MLSTVERINQVQTRNYKSTVVIIDSGIQEYQALVAGIEPTAQVIVLDKQKDGIGQITQAISQQSISSLQLIAHGSPGSLQLGNISLNLDNLHIYQQQLQHWQVRDILIYGCEVAAGEIGKNFLHQLHQLTGANIAASEQKIGNSQLGGSWELGVKIGQISTTLAITPTIRAAYPAVLTSFLPAPSLSVGVRPFSPVVADFNEDGKQDLVVANVESNSVSVLLGQGNGRFSTATNFNVGLNPASVAVADFNEDGKLDLAVTNINSNNVSVLLGQGNGSFGAATNFNVDVRPIYIVAADFNNDGNLDLATLDISSTDRNVSILPGQGNGSFSSAVIGFRLNNSSPASIAVGDFNGDGKQDFVTANRYDSNSVTVLLGQGNNTFGTPTDYTVLDAPSSVVVADFNGDGYQDLATANRSISFDVTGLVLGQGSVGILLGQGDGSFGATTYFNVNYNPVSLAVGDFNGDGYPDLATVNDIDNSVSVLIGLGNGSFSTPTRFGVGLNPDSLTVGDLNGDGYQDIAIANANSNNVSLLLYNDGSMGEQQTFTVLKGETVIIENFDGVGRSGPISSTTIAELDTIKFIGANLTARNMLLTQNGNDLEITFEGDALTKVVLKNFALENLENLQYSTGGSIDIGNILFDGQIDIQDSFDVFDSDANRSLIWNAGTVTFLNDLNNNTSGFDSSDVINGQGGNDSIYGWDGNDLLRGGTGDDILVGGKGDDILVGNEGQDRFQFGTGNSFSSFGLGIDTIKDFVSNTDKIVLYKNTFDSLNSPIGGALVAPDDFAVVNDASNTFIAFSAVALSTAKIVYNLATGGLYYNVNGSEAGFAGFDAGGQFATLTGKPSIVATDFLVV